MVMACASVGPRARSSASANACACSSSAATSRLKNPQRGPLLRRHGARRVEQLRRSTVPDDARQDGARPHVAASEAHARKKKRRTRRRRAKTQVRRHRDAGARAGAHAVDGCDDRLRTKTHLQHEIARHARKFQQLRIAHAGQRANDLVHITTGAEVATGAGDDERFDFADPAQGAEELAELGVGIKRQRVLASPDG